jgi:hypothetical protein
MVAMCLMMMAIMLKVLMIAMLLGLVSAVLLVLVSMLLCGLVLGLGGVPFGAGGSIGSDRKNHHCESQRSLQFHRGSP